MKTLLRFLLCVLAGICLTGLLLWMILTVTGGSDLLAGDGLEACRSLFEGMIFYDAISLRDEAVVRSINNKSRVIRELIDGQLTLEEAIERFHELQGLLDDGQDDMLGPYPGLVQGKQGMCDQVLIWTRSQLLGDPRSKDVMQRLEQQKRVYLRTRRLGT